MRQACPRRSRPRTRPLPQAHACASQTIMAVGPVSGMENGAMPGLLQLGTDPGKEGHHPGGRDGHHFLLSVKLHRRCGSGCRRSLLGSTGRMVCPNRQLIRLLLPRLHSPINATVGSVLVNRSRYFCKISAISGKDSWGNSCSSSLNF